MVAGPRGPRVNHLTSAELLAVADHMQATQGTDLMQAAMVEVIRNAVVHLDECYLCGTSMNDLCGEWTNGELLALAWKVKHGLSVPAPVQSLLEYRKPRPATSGDPV